MGFQDNSDEIIVDAVLTDQGRERLARNDGSFEIVRYRFADDEIDYRFWNELTSSDSKDLKILDTPVLEASVHETIGLKYPLITIRNSKLQYIPSLVAQPSSIAVKEITDQQGGGVDVVVSQRTSTNVQIIPPEIVDSNYKIDVNNDLLFLSNETPISISPFGIASYVVGASAGRQTSAGGSELRFNLRVQTLNSETFDILVGANVVKPRVISSFIRVTGQQSGMQLDIPVTITEYATS